MGATLVVNVHHTVLGVLPAVRRRLAALHIEESSPGAGCM